MAERSRARQIFLKVLAAAVVASVMAVSVWVIITRVRAAYPKGDFTVAFADYRKQDGKDVFIFEVEGPVSVKQFFRVKECVITASGAAGKEDIPFIRSMAVGFYRGKNEFTIPAVIEREHDSLEFSFVLHCNGVKRHYVATLKMVNGRWVQQSIEIVGSQTERP